MKIALFAISLLVLVFAFYWYSYRPEKIRRDCYQTVLQTSDINLNYQSCLRSHGLEK